MSLDQENTAGPAAAARWIDQLLLPAAFWLAVALSAFQLWQSVSGSLPAIYLRSAHIGWILVLILLKKPLIMPSAGHAYTISRILDLGLALVTLWCVWVTWTFDFDDITFMLEGLGAKQLIAGTLFLILVIEGTRRTVGWVMASLGVLFLLYAAFGNVMPEAMAHRGFTLNQIIENQVFSQEGLFSLPLGIAAGVVFTFVLLGGIFEVTGAGAFFINLAYAAAGRLRGGPAKAAVLASAAMGSISGSAVANTVATGAFTIPMMKKLGYRPEQAAGIEAAASTGGQIMPPIMGAGAFLMAEYTGVPYSQIVLISLIPAALYFAVVLLFVHITACKAGLSGMAETPSLRKTLDHGFHFILPLLVITAGLIAGYTPVLVGVAGCATAVAVALVRPHTRIGLRRLIEALAKGAMMMLPISAACATAGILIGVIGQTGIGLRFSDFIIILSGGELWLALILIALASLVLGLGLPVTAAYIVVAVLAAPALTDMGLSLIVAHMIIFWLSQDSNVTPPVALAAYAGAGVAGANPMRTGFWSWKIAKGLYVIPVMMAYTGLMMTDGLVLGLWAALLTGCALVAFACALEGYAFTRMTWPERLSALPILVLLLTPWPSAQALAVAMTVAGALINYRRSRL